MADVKKLIRLIFTAEDDTREAVKSIESKINSLDSRVKTAAKSFSDSSQNITGVVSQAKKLEQNFKGAAKGLDDSGKRLMAFAKGAALLDKPLDRAALGLAHVNVVARSAGTLAGETLTAAALGARAFSSALYVLVPAAGAVGVAIAGLVVPLAALVGVYRLFRESREYFTEQEKASIGLSASLKALGSSIPADKIEALATSLSRASVYTDSMITEAARLLVVFPQVTEETLPKALQATVDFAAYAKVGVSTAAKAVGRASEGMYDSLSRLGIVISDSTKESGNFSNVLSELNTKIGGQAIAQSETWAGRLHNVQKEWQGVLTQIGRIQVLGFGDALDPIISKIVEMGDRLKDAIDRGDLDPFIDKLSDMGDAVARVAVDLLEWFEDLAQAFYEWTQETDINEWFDTWIKQLKTAAVVTYNLLQPVILLSYWLAKLFLIAPLEQFGKATNALFSDLEKTIEDVSDDVSIKLTLADADKQIAEFKALETGIEKMLVDFGQGSEEATNALFAGLSRGVSVIKEAVDSADKELTTLRDDQKRTLQEINDEWETATKDTEITAENRVAAMQDYFKGIRDIAREAIQATTDKINDFASAIQDKIGDNTTTSDSLQEFTKEFKKVADSSIKHLQSIGSALDSFVSKLSGRLTTVKNEISSLTKETDQSLSSIGQTYDQKLREINRRGLSEAGQQLETIDYIANKLREASALSATGNVEDLERAKQIYISLQGEASNLKNSTLARSALEEATKGAVDVTVKLEEKKRQELELQRASLTDQIAKAKELRKEVEDTVKVLQNKLKLTVDKESIEQMISEIKQRFEQEKFSIKVEEERIGAAAGGFVQAKGFARGGPSGTDTIPAWLSPGEYVVRARAVKALGLAFLDKINKAKGYAVGGAVPESFTRQPIFDLGQWALELLRLRRFLERLNQYTPQSIKDFSAAMKKAEKDLISTSEKVLGGLQPAYARDAAGNAPGESVQHLLTSIARQYSVEAFNQGQATRLASGGIVKDVQGGGNIEGFGVAVKTFQEGAFSFVQSLKDIAQTDRTTTINVSTDEKSKSYDSPFS